VVSGWWLVVLFLSEKVRSFRDLRVWQAAIELVESIYRVSDAFPRDEAFGLKAQIRRAAVSVPSNIAEGQAGAPTKEFLNHLSMARASVAEIETQLEIALRLKYLSADLVNGPASLIVSLGKQLHALRNALEAGK
jgi:four helix bundle protein